MAEGVIKTLKDLFGFVRGPDGTEYYFRRNLIPRDVAEGDRVSFEPVTADDGRTQARNIHILERGGRLGRRNQDPDRPARSNTNALGVSWTFGEPSIVDGVDESDQSIKVLELPVYIETKRGNAPAVGFTMALTVNGETVGTPAPSPRTDGLGQTYFVAILSQDATRADFGLNVRDGDKSILVVKRWTRPEPPKAPTCKVIKVANLGFAKGWSRLEIETLADNDKHISTKVVIESGVEIESDTTTPATGHNLEYTTGPDGYGIVQVKLASPAYRGFLIIRDPADRNIKSEPIYVRQPKVTIP